MDFHSSDVNTLFAFVDVRHKFNKVVNNYFGLIKKQKYILLRHVKSVFIFTYRDNLSKIGEIIISSVVNVKNELSKRIIRKNPSDTVKNAILKSKMDKLFEEWGKLDKEDFQYFKNMLLKDFPLIELLNNEDKLKDFDSSYTQKANEIVNNKIEEFIKFFEVLEDSPNLNQVKVKGWYKKIKDMKLNNFHIYTEHKDEDIRLSSEFITYCEDRHIPLNFGSIDENLVDSLKFVTKEENIKCGKIIWLLED